MPVRDAQCGFKALRTSVARQLLPAVRDDGWFFDTELLVRAQRAGYRVVELPVRWVEDRDSRVRIMRTAISDLSGVLRLRRAGVRPSTPGVVTQFVIFCLIGIISTAAYVALFNVLRPSAGAQAANLVSLGVTAVANTAANRRFTFGVRGGKGLLRAQVMGLVSFVLAAALTAGSLTVLHAVVRSTAALFDSAVLVVGSLAATTMRFVLLRFGLALSEPRSLQRVLPPHAS
jgi:putative flippase GtrA